MAQYETYHYDDQLCGQYPSPMLSVQTDDIKAAQAETGHCPVRG